MARAQKIDSVEYKGYTICQLSKNCMVFAGERPPEKCWWFINSLRAKNAIDNNYLEDVQ